MGDQSYIGFVRCPTCGIKHLTDPAKLTVWYSVDAFEQLTTAECPKCNTLIEGRISLEDMVAFRMYGCKFSTLDKKFGTITEEEISKWDIESELTANGF